MRLRSPYTLSTRPDATVNKNPYQSNCNQSLCMTKCSHCELPCKYRGDFCINCIPVVGQNFEERSHEAGKAAYSREYGFDHVSPMSSDGG